jgi:hypothetical protein
MKSMLPAAPRSRPNPAICSRVLSFVAECVNLYNWYLRRSPNPASRLYDETDEVTRKLFEELYKRAKEEVDVRIKLKNSVCMFNLVDDVGDVGDVERNAWLWSEFVRRRQREMVEEDVEYAEDDAECEEMLWRVVQNTTDVPALYVRVLYLEDEYLEMLEHGDVIIEEGTVAERLYNRFEVDGVDVGELVPPAFGMDDVELERVYLRDPGMVPEPEEEEAYYVVAAA